MSRVAKVTVAQAVTVVVTIKTNSDSNTMQM